MVNTVSSDVESNRLASQVSVRSLGLLGFASSDAVALDIQQDVTAVERG